MHRNSEIDINFPSLAWCKRDNLNLNINMYKIEVNNVNKRRFIS